MAWYRAGSVAVTNGSAIVTGTGTAWVANVQSGHAINLPDGRAYEVLSVDSNAQITLGSAYLGGSAGGQLYSVQPNQGFAQTAATRLSDFISQVSSWIAGALAGRFGDGSTAAPGIAYLIALSAATNAASADRDALEAYHAALAAYPAAKAERDAAIAVYEATLSAWEADLEAARQTVDRIAFCGQVPVNVDAATLATCEAALADGEAVYLVAVARGGGIGVAAVREGDMTLPLYMRRIGAVWAIRDGRPWLAVQHG